MNKRSIKIMVYDCFSFFNELDILEIRLNTLNEVVDKFVLVEATRTHTGLPKPLYFEKNKQRFAPFLDKIIHIVVDDYPEIPADCTYANRAWILENYQRNAIARGLEGAAENDTLLITDADEIPHPDIVKRYVGNHGVFAIKQRLYYYYLNLRNATLPFWGDCTYGPKILTVGDFSNPETYEGATCSPQLAFVNALPSASMIRALTAPRIGGPLGWHFSYIGNVQHIQEKLKSYAETQNAKTSILSEENIKRKIAAGDDILGLGQRLFATPLDNSFPIFLQEHADQYCGLLAPTDNAKKMPFTFACGVLKDVLENNVKVKLRKFYNPIRKRLGV